MNIKYWLKTGEFSEPPANTNDILEASGNLLDHACSHDILGEVYFIGEDGNVYRVTVEAVVEKVFTTVVQDWLADPEQIGMADGIPAELQQMLRDYVNRRNLPAGMIHCRFLIGWFNGSDGACGEPTGINSQADLVAGAESNPHVNFWEYDAPAGFEWQVGAAKAFQANFTAHDSLSIVQRWDEAKGGWVDFE